MPYTGKQSRIILSFANSDGGDLFAHWLRDRLMKDLDYYSESAVFLDNIASRNGGEIGAYSTTGATFDTKTDNITTSDGSYLSIGARNKNWFEMWKTALSEAKVLIQIQTLKYFDSNACEREMVEIRKVLDETRNNLEVLAITVDGTCAAMAMGPQPPHTTPMPLNKVPGTRLPSVGENQSPLKLLKDSWIISEPDYKKVAKFVTDRAGDFTLLAA
jgi:hypothetical protein